jgi:hypothetical protein
MLTKTKNSISKTVNKSVKQISSSLVKHTGYNINEVCCSLVLLLVIVYALYNVYKYYNGSTTTVSTVPNVKRPFLNMYAVKKDGTEITTNIVFITHSFTRDDCEENYNTYKKQGIKFLGMSSYSEFPGPISNIHDVLHDPKHKAYTYDYFKLTDGWCSVFREELNKKWIKQGFPCANIAESDFANYDTHKPDPNVKKEYDFIYICLKDNDKCTDGWQSTIRRYDIAKKLIDIMCKKHKLKGLLIGRINCEVPPSCHQLMELTDFQEYNKFISNFNKCKFILTCSEADASPRTVSEAMCYNLPVLMNKKILGGWQYVNDTSGAFFDPDNLDSFNTIIDDFVTKVNNNEYKPRDFIINNYGKFHSGKRLLKFVKEVYKNKESELNFKFDDIDYCKPGI